MSSKKSNVVQLRLPPPTVPKDTEKSLGRLFDFGDTPSPVQDKSLETSYSYWEEFPDDIPF